MTQRTISEFFIMEKEEEQSKSPDRKRTHLDKGEFTENDHDKAPMDAETVINIDGSVHTPSVGPAASAGAKASGSGGWAEMATPAMNLHVAAFLARAMQQHAQAPPPEVNKATVNRAQFDSLTREHKALQIELSKLKSQQDQNPAQQDNTHTMSDEGEEDMGDNDMMDSGACIDWTQEATDFLGTDNTEGEQDFEEDLIDTVAQVYDTEEKLDAELPASTANLVNKGLRNPVPTPREKEMTDKVLRPQNCPSLITPRVNQEIWKTLQRGTKETDVALQRAQTLIHKGLTPLLHALTSLKEKKDRENLKRVLDAFQLLALGSHTLSTSRRQAMATDLFPQFRPLCAPARPFTELLFGEDQELECATRKLKDAQAPAARLGYGTAQRGFPGRGRGRFQTGYRGRGQRPQHQPHRGRGRQPFLGGRAPYQRRRGAYRGGPSHAQGGPSQQAHK